MNSLNEYIKTLQCLGTGAFSAIEEIYVSVRIKPCLTGRDEPAMRRHVSSSSSAASELPAQLSNLLQRVSLV